MTDRIGTDNQPISAVRWVHRDDLEPNDWNPNHVPKVERELLIVSIMESGWTQPIVVLQDGVTIIDGFHRWTVSADPRLYAMTGGFVPVVVAPHDAASRIMATVRHNRARGVHGIRPMGAIVNRLREEGVTDDEIARRLGMEQEEIERLTESRGSPQRVAEETRGEFTEGWEPGKRTRG